MISRHGCNPVRDLIGPFSVRDGCDTIRMLSGSIQNRLHTSTKTCKTFPSAQYILYIASAGEIHKIRVIEIKLIFISSRQCITILVAMSIVTHKMCTKLSQYYTSCCYDKTGNKQKGSPPLF